MTERFSEHLRQHAVPLNESCDRQIRDPAKIVLRSAKWSTLYL